jgi:hypothetical protein
VDRARRRSARARCHMSSMSAKAESFVAIKPTRQRKGASYIVASAVAVRALAAITVAALELFGARIGQELIAGRRQVSSPFIFGIGDIGVTLLRTLGTHREPICRPSLFGSSGDRNPCPRSCRVLGSPNQKRGRFAQFCGHFVLAAAPWSNSAMQTSAACLSGRPV